MASDTAGRAKWLMLVKKPIIALVASLIFGALLLLTVSLYFESQLKSKLRAANIDFSSVRINLLSRRVVVKNVQWRHIAKGNFLKRGNLSAEIFILSGVNWWRAAVNNRIEVSMAVIKKGTFNLALAPNTTVRRLSPKQNLPNFLIGKLRIEAFEIAYHSADSVEYKGKIDLASINGFSSNTVSSGLVGAFEKFSLDIKATNLSVSGFDPMYQLTVGALRLNTAEQKISIDTVRLVPNFGKYEFAKRLGNQTDRITLIIPTVEMKGVKFTQLLEPSITLSSIRIQSFALVAFRDKRISVVREVYVPLPMASLKKLPFHFKIDSIQIKESKVTVEEIPAGRTQASIITFEKLNANLTNLDNRSTNKDLKYATLIARGLLMGVGKIDAVFKLPLHDSLDYTATGTISEMPLNKLNSALLPQTDIRIEQGHLNGLSFSFDYSDKLSSGLLEIDYRNLTLVSLKKDHESANRLKSLILNAMVKNDRNTVNQFVKRTGTIRVLRDRNAFVFNFWWKSIEDGLRSIFLPSSRRKNVVHHKKVSIVQK